MKIIFFCMVKYLSFHNSSSSSFALKCFLMEMVKPQCDTHPLSLLVMVFLVDVVVVQMGQMPCDQQSVHKLGILCTRSSCSCQDHLRK